MFAVLPLTEGDFASTEMFSHPSSGSEYTHSASLIQGYTSSRVIV